MASRVTLTPAQPPLEAGRHVARNRTRIRGVLALKAGCQGIRERGIACPMEQAEESPTAASIALDESEQMCRRL